MFSLYHSLEQAKDFFNHEQFEIAHRQFIELIESNLNSFHDILLGTLYGLAECKRIECNYEGALEFYRKLLQKACDFGLGDGRLAYPNSVGILYGFRALLDIGRLSLRLPAPVLNEMLNAGVLWAEDTMSHDIARVSFGFEEILLERNIKGAFQILPKLEALYRELREDSNRTLMTADDHYYPVNPQVVMIRLYETNIEAQLYSLPAMHLEESTHAKNWISIMYKLLSIRRYLCIGNYGKARKLLSNLDISSIFFKQYPELKLQKTSLDIQLLNMNQNKVGYSIKFLDILKSKIHAACNKIGDLATPLWHVILLMEENTWIQTKGLELSLSKPEISEIIVPIQKATLLLRDVCRYSWIGNVLESRGLTRNEILQFYHWCESIQPCWQWLYDGKPLLTKFRQVILP